MKLWPVLTGIALSFTLIACKAPTPPKGVQPITNFDANRYLGKWYEIARLESGSNVVWNRSALLMENGTTEGFVYLTVDTIQRKINGARAKVKHTLLEILKLQH